MKEYAISVDSACDMPLELREKLGFTMIPLHVMCGDEEFFDGVNMYVKDVFAYAQKNGKAPKTSAVSVGEFIEYFKKLLCDSKAVVHFSITGASSATHQNATLAAAEFPNVYTVDTRSFSAGSALIAVKGSELIEKMGVEQGVAEVRRLIEHFNGSMVLETLEYMKMGGRCSTLATLGANILGIKPSLDIVDGAFQLGKKYRGKYVQASKKYVMDRLAMADVLDRRVAVAGVDITDEVRAAIEEGIAESGKVDETLYMETGCVVSAHAGPNSFGILFFEDK